MHKPIELDKLQGKGPVKILASSNVTTYQYEVVGIVDRLQVTINEKDIFLSCVKELE